jgi:hypothetical protein
MFLDGKEALKFSISIGDYKVQVSTESWSGLFQVSVFFYRIENFLKILT